MKKYLLLLLLIPFAIITLTGCSSKKDTHKGDYINLEVKNENEEVIEIDFPQNPRKIVVLNYITLDYLYTQGLSDIVVGTIYSESMPDYLKEEFKDKVHLGGMKDYNIEKIMELEPHAIFSSDRTAADYKLFSKIAPTYSVSVDYTDFYHGYKETNTKHSNIFTEGKKQIEDIYSEYDARIAKINEFSKGATAALGLFTGNNLNVLGNGSRCSIITNDMGFSNVHDKDVNHGDTASPEYWAETDPEYIFVLDKDAAVGTAAESSAKEFIESNETFKATSAYKNEKIIYLTPGSAWYTNDGGLTALDLMISCIEDALSTHGFEK